MAVQSPSVGHRARTSVHLTQFRLVETGGEAVVMVVVVGCSGKLGEVRSKGIKKEPKVSTLFQWTDWEEVKEIINKKKKVGRRKYIFGKVFFKE